MSAVGSAGGDKGHGVRRLGVRGAGRRLDAEMQPGDTRFAVGKGLGGRGAEVCDDDAVAGERRGVVCGRLDERRPRGAAASFDTDELDTTGKSVCEPAIELQLVCRERLAVRIDVNVDIRENDG